MAAARFQLYWMSRFTHPDAVAPHEDGVSWRFLSANNRSLGRSTRVFPDVGSCLAAVGALRTGACRAGTVFLRDEGGAWQWRVLLDGTHFAVSSHRYQRRVRAQAACASFLTLVEQAEAAPSDVLRFPSRTGPDGHRRVNH